jgi:transposase, IS5 family
MGEEQLLALIQESLAVAHKTAALPPRDLERVVVDTTVQAKPALAKARVDRASDRCPAVSSRTGAASRAGARHSVPLRQSYVRLATRAAIMVGRYTHARQFKRARRELKFLRIRWAG